MLKSGGHLFLGLTMKYEKSPNSIEEQRKILIQRGMQCSDIPRLEKDLSTIGYYQLSAYWLVCEYSPPHTVGKRSHQFKPGTRFRDILNLYPFDRELRLTVLDALERFEVAFRTSFANGLAIGFKDAHAFGIPNMDPLVKLLKSLTSVRNNCAHHSRLWNRKYTMAPPIIKRLKAQYNAEQPKNIHNFLVILTHILAHIDPANSWKKRIVELIRTRPEWQAQDMGFQSGWLDRLPWKEER